MKVYISVDYEGIGSVVSWTQENPETHEMVRRLMTNEANAAIEGAIAAGATEIIVNDSHDTMKNLIPTELRPEAELISGSGKKLSMVEGIDNTFDAAFFIGYHASAGTANGVLDHTYSSRTVETVRINGKRVGETGINAGVCGYFGVPVALVTGDNTLCKQVRDILPNVVAVAVKEGLGRYSARSLHPTKACQAVKEGAKLALEQLSNMTPLTYGEEVDLELTFLYSSMADGAELIPHVKRIGPKTVRYTDSDYIRVFKAMRAMIAIAGTTIE